MAGNQYVSDPRQAAFLKAYLDPNSKTFSNALQSGIAAGYSEEYSKTIISKELDWVSESVKDKKLIEDAEKALQEAVNYPTMDETGKVDAGVAKIKQDTAKFITSRLQKNKWSDRTEHTGKDGKELPQPIIQLNAIRTNDSDE